VEPDNLIESLLKQQGSGRLLPRGLLSQLQLKKVSLLATTFCGFFWLLQWLAVETNQHEFK
jgi:hypothetical protein